MPRLAAAVLLVLAICACSAAASASRRAPQANYQPGFSVVSYPATVGAQPSLLTFHSDRALSQLEPDASLLLPFVINSPVAPGDASANISLAVGPDNGFLAVGHGSSVLASYNATSAAFETAYDAGRGVRLASVAVNYNATTATTTAVAFGMYSRTQTLLAFAGNWSANSGWTWAPAPIAAGGASGRPLYRAQTAFTKNNNAITYFSDMTTQPYRSSTGGQLWLPSGVFYAIDNSAAVLTLKDGSVVVVGNSGGSPPQPVLACYDENLRGKFYLLLNNNPLPSGAEITGLALDGSPPLGVPQQWMLATAHHGLWLSTDGQGRTWSLQAGTDKANVTWSGVAYSPELESFFAVGTDVNGGGGVLAYNEVDTWHIGAPNSSVAAYGQVVGAVPPTRRATAQPVLAASY